MGLINFIKANESDFAQLQSFYQDVISNTEHMRSYARWEYGKHPTDAMIQRYIRQGTMFFCEKDGTICSAAAITPQGEDYHHAAWSIPLGDEEVSVVHLLCVAPGYQGQGIARQTMGRIVELSRATGKKAVRLDALASNIPAHRLYESLGFQKRDQKRWDTENVGQTDFFLYELVLSHL